MCAKNLFICLLVFTVYCKAQNNLIVWDENGQKFLLFVDDKQINDSAQSEVKASKIYDDTCHIKAVFQNKNNPDFNAKVFLVENGKAVSLRDFTYSISKDKGKMKLNFISMNYTLSDTSTKVLSPEARIKSIFTAKAKQKEENDKLNDIYPPPSACIKAISDSAFQKKIKILKDNHIALQRMREAKWFVSHNCINTKQLIQLLATFDYNHDKTVIGQFAFDYLEDHRNFLEVVDSIEPGVEKNELKKFYDKRIEK